VQSAHQMTLSPLRDDPVLVAEPRGGVPELTDTPEKFAAALDDLAACSGPLAVDAERASEYRYSDEDYVIQMRRDGSQTYLFDVPALVEAGCHFSDITDRMPSVEWILHDAVQDLPGFADLGMRPSHLFDTEFAARFLNMKHAGLAACTAAFLGLTLAKEHAAADWSARPLLRDLRNYAALDVELLIQLRNAMDRQLIASGKKDWARQEFDHILAKGLAPRRENPEPWIHVSNITKLGSDRRALGIVRELWYARDQWARELDIAPQLLLTDATIIEAAARKPRNKRQFAAIEGLNRRVVRNTGTEQDKMFARYIPLQEKVKKHVWRDAIKKALKLRHSQLPDLMTYKIHDGTSYHKSMKYWRTHQPARYVRLEQMRRAVAQISQDVAIPVDLIIKPRLLKEACWDEIQGDEMIDRFRERGAREWQIRLVSKSLSAINIGNCCL
jgi:ribonuclease D